MRSSSGECYLDLSVIEGMPFCDARSYCMHNLFHILCVQDT